jgi:hypothetical protein
MLSIVEAAWLFTRGTDSVRIVRAAGRRGAIHLLVHGPSDAADTREFEDVVACMNYQADLERRLVDEGFALERLTSDRRSISGQPPRGLGERRRG